jgi:hypothetical protein
VNPIDPLLSAILEDKKREKKIEKINKITRREKKELKPKFVCKKRHDNKGNTRHPVGKF